MVNPDASELRERLVERIRADGPISFAEYMRAALYDPELGYYCGGGTPWPKGAQGGDYTTIPQVSPALGYAIGRLVTEADELLARPTQFALVEVGSGDGALLASVLSWLGRQAPELVSRLEVWSVEAGRSARRAQRQRPEFRRRWGNAEDEAPACGDQREGAPINLTWLADVEQLPWGFCGLVYSNELLDAMPVHQVRATAAPAILQEVFVAERAGRLEFDHRPPAVAVLDHLLANGVSLEPGQVTEVCLQVEVWLRAVVDRLTRGYVLTIDYGHETRTLHGASRSLGTLVCQSKYRLNDEPLRCPGKQDITAHVDFGNLRRCGLALGMADLGFCSLRVFLTGLALVNEAMEAATDRERLAIRHAFVSEIGDAHKAMLQSLDAPTLRFGRARLER